jgi:hypothetical protein
MRYSEVLQRLYSNDLNKVISVLQKSIYSTELDKRKDGIIAVHTGFTFVTHKSKLMEILVCFNENSNEIIIIRQNRADWNYRKIPLLNGLQLFGDKDYFDRFYPLILAEVIEENDDYNLKGFEIKEPLKYLDINLISEVQSDDSDEVIKSIKIKIENNELIEYPLQRNYETKIYFDGKIFKEYILNDSNYEDDNHYNDYEERPSYEDWLNSEFGDDAETAYWNNE